MGCVQRRVSEAIFSKNVRGKKEIEFLELKQGNSIIVEYVAKFEELVIFCPHYNDAIAEVSKCIKFENWLCPKIKQGIRYREIRRFLELVNKCIIYDEDSRVRSSHYKSLSEKRGRRLNCEKLYSVLADKGKQRILDGRRPSAGGALAPIKCYRCGGAGHHANECKSDEKKCFKCGKSGHLIADCKTNVLTCYNCGEPGHISTTFQKSKKSQLEGRLIRGTCYIHDIPMIAIIGTGATHSFISANCVRKMGLVLSTLNDGLVVDTLANSAVTTSLFLAPKDKQEDNFISAKELKELLKYEAKAFAMFTSLSVESQATIEGLPVVCEFLEVFPYDMFELSPKREVEFTIDLVPGTMAISMEPYRMFALELKELKNQFEDYVQSSFILDRI
ncbi:uncharacterized protein LOC127079257 [Lathyrus oleraceus]|uniref:uncharacterized protein LOC127079257 n=1 Tax=Pisum sativum TaxID=3888 RepID=UPI0021CEE37B|nr:uncharacterized protein LOC127079257 [Pisum sativum]